MTRSASALALAVVFAGCNGTTGSSGTTTTSGTTTATIVSDAATQAQSTHTSTVDCFGAFQTCIDAAASDSDVTACQTALASCLPTPTSVGANGVPDLCNAPPPPDGPGDHGGGQCGDGGMMPPPPPPDGGAPGDHGPPPGMGPGGNGPQGGNGGQQGGNGPQGGNGNGGQQGGNGGNGGPQGGNGGQQGGQGPGPGAGPIPVSPAGRIALATCHAELKKCLAAGTDATTCTTTAHSCVHEALEADFKLLCDAVATQCASCATAQVCVDLTARCAAGLTFPDQPGATK
jgi:hypothetical protein